MLQRAASNAYSWWWASHIRTKQSKWLDNSLQEMEEKVNSMMKLIEEDADTFGKKAELYFRRRPELMNFVEEIYKAYKALADRYDRVSGELHKANHTIASVFPDQVELAMQDDEDDSSPKAITSIDLSKFRRPTEGLQFSIVNKDNQDYTAPKRQYHRRISSQISKEKAQEDIERLQKEILVLQTEKEFNKSSYESTLTRYLDIERQIAELQEEVCSLQDAFSASAIIEDNEARALMAATAIKSCEDSLLNLQEQQKITTQEARMESERIKEAELQLITLKGKCCESEVETTETSSDQNIQQECTIVETEDFGVLKEEKLELESMCQKVKEHFEMRSESSVVELAEKIDELVDKVISLELTVSSQTAQIKRLRSETDQLQEHLRSLEEDKMVLVDNSNSLTEKLKQAEDELQRIQYLEKCLQNEKGILRQEFIEACRSLSDLSEQLQSPTYQESANYVAASQDGGSTVSDNISVGKTEEENHVKMQNAVHNLAGNQAHEQSANELEKFQRDVQRESEVTQDFDVGVQLQQPDDGPDLQNSVQNGLEGGEEVLLAEYTSIVHNYKDTKQRLAEIERKNQEYHLETMAQVKELKSANVMKDEEIRLLKEILNSLQASLNVNAPRIMEKSRYQVDENVTTTNAAFDDSEATKTTLAEDSIQLCQVGEPQASSAIEDKFRTDIDTLLEENLDFWLRFCTSYHQIQEFQKTFKNLKSDIEKLNETRNQEGNEEDENQGTLPVDRRLRELNTELQVWLEKNAVLNGELKCRFSSLCSIQDEISRVSKANESEEVRFIPYQAAKFQGEVLSMQLENNKVAKELQAGLDYVRGLQVEISWTLSKLNKNFELAGSRYNQQNSHQHHPLRHLSTKTRVPLRTFLFGTKPKKPSIFSCMNPALHKQYNGLRSSLPR
ncbi:protein NETWORKED 2D-like [Musa acuminata AAA Group]|uniref:protein NETWORKED 2D-like n=1 Tax=Musa acuminata AAA Group TaxID=214697 RepID=UPI0031CDF41B